MADYTWLITGGTLLADLGNQIWVRMDDLFMEIQCHVTGTSAENCYSPQGSSVVYVEQCWSFSALPNPTSTSLTVEVPKAKSNKPVGVELINNLGEAVKSYVAYDNRFEIDTRNIPEGVYILKAHVTTKLLIGEY